MGWWPFGGSGDKPADPLGNLDPKLREFLDKESPLKYKGSSSSSTNSTTAAATTADEASPVASAAAAQQSAQQTLPAESLYQDGRYAHLWKNYRPQAEVEAEHMTDHERLMSVLEAYQERKSNISRVAMENCAEAQEEWVNCMKHGKLEDQLQMCRHQVRSFEKCYTMQSRFLRALGYGSVAGRPQRTEDQIQMHADKLYQRVLQHEVAVEQAKKDGTPVPKFDPAVVIPRPGAGGADEIQPSDELRAQWREKLDQLPEAERAVEEAALRADLQTKSGVARTMKEYYGPKKKTADKEGGGDGAPPAGDAQKPQQKSVADTIVTMMTGR